MKSQLMTFFISLLFRIRPGLFFHFCEQNGLDHSRFDMQNMPKMSKISRFQVATKHIIRADTSHINHIENYNFQSSFIMNEINATKKPKAHSRTSDRQASEGEELQRDEKEEEREKQQQPPPSSSSWHCVALYQKIWTVNFNIKHFHIINVMCQCIAVFTVDGFFCSHSLFRRFLRPISFTSHVKWNKWKVVCFVRIFFRLIFFLTWTWHN